jgi:hypothetical protein
MMGKGDASVTSDEINLLTDKLYGRFRNIPGIDRTFIQKCVLGISALGDPDVEAKIKYLSNFL